MQVNVFIQNEAGSDLKHDYNEKTLEYQGTDTVSRRYPFPYGFILDTTSEDGDNLDCYVITQRPLKTGPIIACEAIVSMPWAVNLNEKKPSKITPKGIHQWSIDSPAAKSKTKSKSLRERIFLVISSVSVRAPS